MNNSIITLFAVLFFGLSQTAGAATTAGTLVVEGRSIPENSIAVSPALYGSVGQSFILDGTKSQDDGVVRTYSWIQVSGPVAKLSGASTIKPTFTPSVAGTYVFELVVTDATGQKEVAQKLSYIVGDPDFDQLKVTPPPPPPPSPSGDPDFDLLRVAPPPSVSIGDMDRDGAADVVSKTAPVSPPPPSPTGLRGSDSGVSDTRAETVMTITNEGRDRAPEASVALDGSMSGDPDFDLLNVSIGGDELEKFRVDTAAPDTSKKVTVRGWDPEKKEEIVRRPEEVKTSEDLKIYVEATALNDDAIEDITIQQDALRVTSKEEGKLFWLIPVEMSSVVTVQYRLTDSSEDLVSVKLPWWNVFVKKNYGAGELDAELTGVFDPTKWQKIDNTEAPAPASRISQALSLVSNVLKTKHDTAKNSVGNIR